VSSPAEVSESLDPERLAAHLATAFPQPANYLVGFSGGLDSTVLLHLLAAARDRLLAPLIAVHVDHDLQPGSSGWAEHCRATCDRLGVALLSRTVDAHPRQGESPEAAAREARYAAIAELMGVDDMLLTAHHQDDQAETLLLQLLRGAGVDGLAAMPALCRWQSGWLARPLLMTSRAAIRQWAGRHDLRWVEDPSNRSTAADRNFLRHEVMPLLSTRWPAATERVAHSAGLCAEAADLLRAQAEADHAMATDANGCLSVTMLVGQDDARARQLVRFWLRQRGARPLPARRLRELLRQLREAAPSAAVALRWPGGVIRRYRDRLWYDRGEHARPPDTPMAWRGEPLSLGPGLGRVHRIQMQGGIDPAYWHGHRVEIVFRQAGLQCQPAGRTGTRSFKKLAQEQGIPPWLRDRLPVLMIDGEVAAIANCCVCQPFAVPAAESGWAVRWEPGVPAVPEPASHGAGSA
jgi:tRNA(Ile)-lysidine synthase